MLLLDILMNKKVSKKNPAKEKRTSRTNSPAYSDRKKNSPAV